MAPSQLYLTVISLIGAVYAHDHQAHNIAPDKHVSADPIDVILWLHILIQTITWMFIFPAGMILGITRSRWHVPVQVGGLALATTGYFFGHAHGGREFRSNVHGRVANLLTAWLAAQAICGFYLKLHREHKYSVQIRRAVLVVHSVLGIGMPAISWVQVILGGLTAAGFCHGSNAGQCVVRIVSGSALIGAGFFLIVVLAAERCGITAQFGGIHAVQTALTMFSSGIVLLVDWIYKSPARQALLDIVSIGFIWLCAVVLLVFLDRISGSQIPRIALPGILLLISGWYLAADPTGSAASVLYGALGLSMQAVGVSHLFAAAIANQIEKSYAASGQLMYIFRFLAAYFLSAIGFLFMGTNKEQIQLLLSGSIPATAFVLLLHCANLLLLCFVLFLGGVLSRHYTITRINRGQSGSIRRESQEQLLGKGSGPSTDNLVPAEHFYLGDIIV